MQFAPFLILFLVIFDVEVNIAKDQSIRLVIDSLPVDSFSKKLPLEIDQFIDNEITFKIPIITCQELKKIQENGHPKLVVLDARSKRAFNVSHIKDAKRVGYEDFSIEHIWFIDTNVLVVIYCEDGRKSEQIALELKKIGFKHIKNLYGSIYEWSKQGLPIVNKKGKRTQRIFAFRKQQRIH